MTGIATAMAAIILVVGWTTAALLVGAWAEQLRQRRATRARRHYLAAEAPREMEQWDEISRVLQLGDPGRWT